MGNLLTELESAGMGGVERLEQVLSRLERLEQRLGPILDQLDQAPGMLAMLGDMFDEYARRAASEGISLEQSGLNLLQLTLKLGQELGPEQAASLVQLLRVAAGNPQTAELLTKLTAAAVPAPTGSGQAPAASPPAKLGLFGLLRVLKEPASYWWQVGGQTPVSEWTAGKDPGRTLPNVSSIRLFATETAGAM